ncbi:MAG: type II toxin-antitoxin system RelE/ParE family toxin [Pseudomonadota bacterium]
MRWASFLSPTYAFEFTDIWTSQAIYRLHQLKDELEGHWAIDVSKNWRIIFRFEDVMQPL